MSGQRKQHEMNSDGYFHPTDSGWYFWLKPTQTVRTRNLLTNTCDHHLPRFTISSVVQLVLGNTLPRARAYGISLNRSTSFSLWKLFPSNHRAAKVNMWFSFCSEGRIFDSLGLTKFRSCSFRGLPSVPVDGFDNSRGKPTKTMTLAVSRCC